MGRYPAEFSSPDVAAFIGFAAQNNLVRFVSAGASTLPGDARDKSSIGGLHRHLVGQ